jgi:hypothetical protein
MRVKERNIRVPTTSFAGKTQSALERGVEFERKLLFLFSSLSHTLSLSLSYHVGQ